MKTLMRVFRGTDRQEKKLWIGTLMCMFIVAGVFGFGYETIFYYFDRGMILKRGAMFLPMVPIYSFGSLLIFAATYDLRRRPWLVLLVSGLVTGVQEYVTGYLMYHLGNGYRAWDYNTEIWNWGNIDGFVCFRSVAFFAVSGLLLIYVIVPGILKLARMAGPRRFALIVGVLTAIVLADFVYNYAITSVTGLNNARVVFEGLGWPS